MVELDKKARAFLEGKNFAHVATLSGDGTVRVSPVWVDIEDGRPVFNTAVGNAKEKNMRRDPRVTLAVQDMSDPYTYLEVVGVAEMTLDGAEEGVDALAKKYLDLDEYPGRQPGEKRVKIFVNPTRVAGILEPE